MNRVVGLSAVCLGVVLLLCNSTNPVATTDDSFPLAVGNRWDLMTVREESFLKEIHYEVVGSPTVEGSRLYLLRVWCNDDTVGYVDTVTIGENDKIRFGTNSFGGYVVDFSRSDNEVYQSGEYLVTVKTPVTVETPEGEIDNCIDFYFDVPECCDEECGYTFAPGIGLIRVYGAWAMDCRLMSHVLNR